ncbi:hypothetical protein L6164_001123 [Bauhinia variegata]|uniref:Uncharacterized protein n=1 Tax=Bauhinia variegata TaxID=167791 RepID=A0ACB9Q8S0_BAUVA|nr:hypothetical protein L6164_001123 [Bauhinia variegata]
MQIQFPKEIKLVNCHCPFYIHATGSFPSFRVFYGTNGLRHRITKCGARSSRDVWGRILPIIYWGLVLLQLDKVALLLAHMLDSL